MGGLSSTHYSLSSTCDSRRYFSKEKYLTCVLVGVLPPDLDGMVILVVMVVVLVAARW